MPINEKGERYYKKYELRNIKNLKKARNLEG
jgi:hypothetical protein